MALRTWGKVVLATLGVGIITSTSQLGLAYGLGIVSFSRVFAATGRNQWAAQLTWVCWCAITATALSIILSRRIAAHWATPRLRTHDESSGRAPRPGGRPARQPADTLGARLALTIFASLGAAVAVPLMALPAWIAQVAGTNAVLVVGLGASLGTLAGAVVGYAALVWPPLRWSVGTVIGVVWVIAVASVVPSLRPGEQAPVVRLGVFDAGFLPPLVAHRFAVATMPAVALVAGAVIGWLARRRGLPVKITMLAGASGPALVTVAYLLAGPGDGADRSQMIPYWAAVAATGMGLIGSTLAALLRPSPAQQPTGPAQQPTGDAAHVSPPADDQKARRTAGRGTNVGAKNVDFVDWVNGLGGDADR